MFGSSCFQRLLQKIRSVGKNVAQKRVDLHTLTSGPIRHFLRLFHKPSIFREIRGSARTLNLAPRLPSDYAASATPLALPTRIRRQGGKIEPSTRRYLTMSWLRRAFTLPVHESKVVLVLMLCVVSMSLMSVALVWQAQIIASQREAIQWLQSFKFGG